MTIVVTTTRLTLTNGQVVDRSLSANGGQPPYTWFDENDWFRGTGLTLSSDGRVTGTARGSGGRDVTATVIVNDSVGDWADGSVLLTFKDTPAPAPGPAPGPPPVAALRSSGICVTRADGVNLDANFVWEAARRNALEVAVRYGAGADRNNVGTATIPIGSTVPVPIASTPADPAMYVQGNVQAAWGAGNNSYVVTFSGAMVRSDVNNVFSSDLIGSPAFSGKIIVAASL